jgi:hypothetical protein
MAKATWNVVVDEGTAGEFKAEVMATTEGGNLVLREHGTNRRDEYQSSRCRALIGHR